MSKKQLRAIFAIGISIIWILVAVYWGLEMTQALALEGVNAAIEVIQSFTVFSIIPIVLTAGAIILEQAIEHDFLVNESFNK